MHDAPDRTQVVKTFGKEAADFIEVAASLGWKCLFNNTGTSVTLVPAVNDAPSQRIHLSSRHKGGGLMRKYAKKLAKNAAPDAIDMAMVIADSGLPFEVARELQLGLGKMALEDEGQREVLPDEPKKERFVKPAAVTPAAVAAKVKKERHVISERPALMHYSLTQSKGGQSYPSKTTIERRWSDGAIDYVCAVSTCDKISDNRLAFRGAHWAMHVRKGEAEPYDEQEAKKSLVDDPSYTEPAWSRKQSLRDKRMAELKTMLDAVDLKKVTTEDLAEMIMDFLGEGRGGGGFSEPLTDEQIIDRIRSLVDRGTYAEQESLLAEQKRALDDLMDVAAKREEELLQQVFTAQQEAIATHTHLQALRDLINESLTGKEE